VESFSTEKNDQVREAILKIVADSKEPSSGGGGRRRRGESGGTEGEGEPKVELGPPPEVGIIYR